ncbi:MAG: hypothetical protein R3E64_09490 [Halioglobus sp.]
MNWEAIGSVGDAIGGVGVVLTLLYLAHQTRQNTRAVRAASFQQVADSLSDVSMTVVQDPSLVSLLMRVNSDAASLSEEDTARYGYFLLATVRRIESLFFHAAQGTIESHSWYGTQQTLHFIFGKEIARQWWAENAVRFNADFREYMDQNVIARSQKRVST